MSRYIKFDDAVKIMACEMYVEAQSQGYDVDGIEDFMPEAKAWITDAPSIDIEPKRGEWVKVDDVSISCRCSVCGWEAHLYEDDVYGMPYCPNCGTHMKGASKNPLAGIEPKPIPTKKHTFVYRKGVDDE